MKKTATANIAPSQIKALKILARAGSIEHPASLNREEIERKAGITLGSSTLGAVTPYVPAPLGSLQALGLVTTDFFDDRGRYKVYYTLTDKGREVALSYRVRDRVTDVTVPVDVLDRAVLAIRPTRTYGFELYTEEDLTAIRALLPADYHDVPLESLRSKVISRRKAGAYTDQTEWPAWYIAHRQRMPKVTLPCALNANHVDNVKDYHTGFNYGWQVRTVRLCVSCYRRNRKALPTPPPQQPVE